MKPKNNHLNLSSTILCALILMFSWGSELLNATTSPTIHDVTVVEKTLTGSVVDASTGESLPTVNVVVQGTTIGTSTDFEGRFELVVPDDAQILVFSYVGYVTQEVEIGSQTTFDIALQPDFVALEDRLRADCLGAILPPR